MGISLASLLAVPLERALELRKELETEYGMDDGGKEGGSPSSDEEARAVEEKVKVNGSVQVMAVEPNPT